MQAITFQPLAPAKDHPDPDGAERPGGVGRDEGDERSQQQCYADRRERPFQAPPDGPGFDAGAGLDGVESEQGDPRRDPNSGAVFGVLVSCTLMWALKG